MNRQNRLFFHWIFAHASVMINAKETPWIGILSDRQQRRNEYGNDTGHQKQKKRP